MNRHYTRTAPPRPNWHLAHVDLDIVGLILMIAGVAGLILGFVQQSMANRSAAQGYREPDDRPPPGH